MRLVWSPGAIRDLEGAAEWSWRQAEAAVDAAEWLANHNWPAIGRRIGATDERFWPVPPLALVYRVSGDSLEVLEVVDMRRLSEPR